jgi:hypothetical protein
MSIDIQVPPPLADGGGPTGEDPYASDVFRLIRIIRATGALPGLLGDAELLASDFRREFAQSIQLHVDSTDSREILFALQFVQLSFDAAAILFRHRERPGEIALRDVALALEDLPEKLALTELEFGSWLGDFRAYLGEHVTNEEAFSFIAVLAATIGLAASLATANPVIIAAATLTELGAINRFSNALTSPPPHLASLHRSAAATTLTLQAGPIVHAILRVDGSPAGHSAFVRFLRKSAVWLPIRRRKITARPTGVPARILVTFESYGGLTDDQRRQIARLAESMNLGAEWIQ